MNVFLWILQVLLGVAFIGAGAAKALQPKQRLQERMPWVEDFNQPTVRFIGTVEVLGGIGLIVPALTGIAPILTPLAAVGLGITMLLAAIVHIRRKEFAAAPINLVLVALLAVIAWGRFGLYSF